MTASATTPVTAILQVRHDIVAAIRAILDASGHLEVHTPIFHPYPDITPTSQFATKHPVTDQPGYLRVAPTEHLKRLLARGAQRIYEFAPCFRPEKPDATHLFEFLSLEVMQTGGTCESMTNLVEQLIRAAVLAVADAIPPSGNALLTGCADRPWPRLSLPVELRKDYGFSPEDFFDDQRVLNLAATLIKASQFSSAADAMDEIVVSLAARHAGPVFVTHYPVYLGGPARPLMDSHFKERAELFLGSLELANMSATLNDRFLVEDWYARTHKSKQRAGLISELDHALIADIGRIPASAVCGIGIDRLAMVCMGKERITEVRPLAAGDFLK